MPHDKVGIELWTKKITTRFSIKLVRLEKDAKQFLQKKIILQVIFSTYMLSIQTLLLGHLQIFPLHTS